MNTPVLIVCAHGTNNPAGQSVVLEIVATLRKEHPEITIVDAYVDVQEPSLSQRLTEFASQEVIVVPLLLARGYHSEHDIPDAAAKHQNARITATVGPDLALVTVLLERLKQAGAEPCQSLVLAVAGSTRDSGGEDARQMQRLLQQSWQGPVTLAFCSAAQPRLADIELGPDQVIASYLIGPGFFHDQIKKIAAHNRVSGPLGAHRDISQIIWDRFNSALTK